MQKKKLLLLLGILIGLCAGCGKKGPIVPQTVKLPQEVADLQVVQQGTRIVLSWENPDSYTDGSPLETISKIEIWAADSVLQAEKAAVPITPGEFSTRASLLKSLDSEEFIRISDAETGGLNRPSYSIDIQTEDFGTKRIAFGLRVITGRRRKSAYSNLIIVEPKILPQAPQNLRARIHLDRIELEWDPPDKNIDESTPAALKGYFVYRSEAEGGPVRLNAVPLEVPHAEDRNFSFGRTYVYTVRASAADSPPFAESDPAPEIRIEARDTFPPQPPHGCIAIVGRGFVALSWEANRESDLMGYRVLRKSRGEKSFIPLMNQPFPENEFTDRTVQAASDYIYVVTAVDRQGNESRYSDETQVHLEGDP